MAITYGSYIIATGWLLTASRQSVNQCIGEHNKETKSLVRFS